MGHFFILITYSSLTKYHHNDSNYRFDTVRAMNRPAGHPRVSSGRNT